MGIDGEVIEFEWKMFPRFSSLSILGEIQQDLEKRKIQPEEFTDRIIFMSMFNDIEWKKNDENCVSIAEKSGHLVFKGISPESWSLEAKARKNLHSLQRRFYQHRTLVTNCSGQCLQSRGGLVLPIRFYPRTRSIGNKMQERVLSFDGLASKIQLTQSCEKKAYFQHLVAAGKRYKVRPNGDDGLLDAENTRFLDNIRMPKLWQLFLKVEFW